MPFPIVDTSHTKLSLTKKPTRTFQASVSQDDLHNIVKEEISRLVPNLAGGSGKAPVSIDETGKIESPYAVEPRAFEEAIRLAGKRIMDTVRQTVDAEEQSHKIVGASNVQHRRHPGHPEYRLPAVEREFRQFGAMGMSAYAKRALIAFLKDFYRDPENTGGRFVYVPSDELPGQRSWQEPQDHRSLRLRPGRRRGSPCARRGPALDHAPSDRIHDGHEASLDDQRHHERGVDQRHLVRRDRLRARGRGRRDLGVPDVRDHR